MSTNIFASLESFVFTAQPKSQPVWHCGTAGSAHLSTPAAGLKCSLPTEFKSDNSQLPRSTPYDSSPMPTSGPLPPPNFTGLNMLTIALQYFADRNVNAEDSEDVICFVQVCVSKVFFLLFWEQCQSNYVKRKCNPYAKWWFIRSCY